MATSTVLKAVGLTTVVGVAGVAALQFLDTPADNTAFNPAAQYDPGEVVYVAGGGAGAYASGGFSMDGYASERSGTSLNVSSAQINRLDRLTSSTPQTDDVTEDNIDPSDPRAYQMGGSEGLGMNANVANEAELQNNPMAMMGNMMSSISNITQGVQGAAAGATPAQDGAAAGTAPALASAQKNWSKGAATGGGAGGNSFNSSFVVQDSGKSASDGANVSPEQAADMMKQFQGQMSSIHEKNRMRSRSSFGNADGLLENSGDSSVNGGFANSKAATDLEFARKRSVDVAKNKNRATTDPASSWLASVRQSGSITLTKADFQQNPTPLSKDFDKTYEKHLRGIKNWGANVGQKLTDRDNDLNNVKTWFWAAFTTAFLSMALIVIFKPIPIWGKWVALALAIAATLVMVAAMAIATDFLLKYKDIDSGQGWAISMYPVMVVLITGTWLCFAYGGAIKEAMIKAFKAVKDWFGTILTTV